MKIRLTRPLPQPDYGKVIPAGVVIDAPPALSRRLLQEGRGEPAQNEGTATQAVATPKKKKSTRRKAAKRDG